MNRRPVRVLFVHNSADLYGASRSLLRLVQRLDPNRFQPVVVLPEPGPLQELLACWAEVVIHPDLNIITRPVFRSWRILTFCLRFPLSVGSLWRLIRSKQIDLVHTNTGVISAPPLAARLAGVPHVWHIRDWFQEFSLFWYPYRRYIQGCSSRVLAVSESVASQFLDRDKVTVLHNGLELSEFDVPRQGMAHEFRQRWGLGNEFVVGCVGRIKWVRKGQETLVRAAAVLEAKGLHAKYVIVGSAFPGNESHEQRLRELICELGLEGKVILTGEISDTRSVYPGLDVLVLPSGQPEPLGGVVLEAMAMGVPVIATRLGGSPDMVVDGVTGFLIPPHDPQALADKIEVLMNDPDLKNRMKDAGPERIEKHFSLRNTVSELETIYAEALR